MTVGGRSKPLVINYPYMSASDQPCTFLTSSNATHPCTDPKCPKAGIVDLTVGGRNKPFVINYPQTGAAVLKISAMNYTQAKAAGDRTLTAERMACRRIYCRPW